MANIKKRNLKKEKKEPSLTPAKNSEKYTSPAKNKVKNVKSYLKDLGKIPSLSSEEMEKLLSLVVLGMVQDRFGMEVSLDTRLKALELLNKLYIDRESQKRELTEENQIAHASEILFSVKQNNRKVDEENADTVSNSNTENN